MIRVCLLTAIFLAIGFGSLAYGENQSNSETASLRKADLLLKQGKFDQAKAIYKNVLARNPESSSAHCGYGWALYVTGQRDEAIAEEMKSLAFNQKNADAHHHLGSIYFASGLVDEAIEEFNIAISIDPSKKCNCGALEARLEKAAKRSAQPVK